MFISIQIRMYVLTVKPKLNKLEYYPHATKSRHRLIPAEGLGELGEIVTIIEV